MKTILKIFLLILITAVVLTGCWSKRELNEIAVVSALGIDKTEEGYLVTVQIINPSEIAGKTSTGRAEVVRYIESGGTVSEALRKISTENPRTNYLAHLREVVFGEELAREGIGEVLDFFSRDHELRSDFYLVVARNTKAHEILNVTTPLEKVPSNQLYSMIENSEKIWSPTKTMLLDELISNIVSKGKESVLMGIYKKGDTEQGSKFENIQDVSPSTILRLDALAVFKKDRMLGWIDHQEGAGYNYLIDNVDETVADVPCGDKLLSIETQRSKTSVKGKVVRGKPVIDITVFSEGNVRDVQCSIDLTDPKNIKNIEAKYQKHIKGQIEKVIKTMQEKYQSDIFGFGEVIHRADPKAWKKLEPDWDQEFSELQTNVHVRAEIRRLGTVSNSFLKDLKE